MEAQPCDAQKFGTHCTLNVTRPIIAAKNFCIKGPLTLKCKPLRSLLETADAGMK